jgi:vesicular inhibitory amino acid transporter
MDTDSIKTETSGSQKAGEFKSVVNLVLTAVGVGMLALPRAVAQSGWAVGICLLAVTWGLSQFMMHLLWKCIQAGRSRPDSAKFESYGGIGEAALGKYGRYIVSFSMYTGLSAICVIILILLGGGLFNLTATLDLQSWIRIAALCILPLSWLPTLKEVGTLSAVGVFAVSVVGIVVLAASISMNPEDRGEISATPASAQGLAMSFIEFMNSYTVSPVIPTLVAGMANPSRYPRAATFGFAIITFTFAVVAFAGYAGWGDFLLSPNGGNITDAIANSANRNYKMICEISIIIVSLSHFLVMFNPVALLCDSTVGKVPIPCKGVFPLLAKMVGRSCMVGILLLLALYVPSFGTVVDLVGSTVVMPLQVFFPITFYYILCRDEIQALSTFKRTALYTLFISSIFLGLGVMCYGLYNVFTHWGF